MRLWSARRSSGSPSIDAGTDGAGGRDRAWAGVRFDPTRARRGHVESWFLKANDPRARRAVWLKWTLWSGDRAPARAVADQAREVAKEVELIPVGVDVGGLLGEDRVRAPSDSRVKQHDIPLQVQARGRGQLQLFGHQHGKPGHRALAHLGAGCSDRDRVVRRDRHPAVDFGRARGRMLQIRPTGYGKAQSETAARNAYAYKKRTAMYFAAGTHRILLCRANDAESRVACSVKSSSRHEH